MNSANNLIRFLGVDAYWALCMAINVYLAFFRNYTVEQLRALDVRYLLACYGLSFVPAFVFIFISWPKSIYGDAIIWCWISSDWDYLRLVVLYAIVWYFPPSPIYELPIANSILRVALLLSLIVYIMAARVIYKKRHQLDGFLNPWNESPFANTITTEIKVETEDKKALTGDKGQEEGGQPVGFEPETEANDAAYSVNVEVGQRPQHGGPAALNIRSVTRDVAANESNAEAWLYARVAFLFFFALAVTCESPRQLDCCTPSHPFPSLMFPSCTNSYATGIPASINRIYGVVNPNYPNFGLNYASSFVFPLQGFWNVLVYIITSRTACKDLWASLRGRGAPLSTMSSRKGFKIGSPKEGSIRGKYSERSRSRTGKAAYQGDEEEGVMMGDLGSKRQRFGSQGSGWEG